MNLVEVNSRIGFHKILGCPVCGFSQTDYNFKTQKFTYHTEVKKCPVCKTKLDWKFE